ncbi:Oidioi.mRNA.OKI2018_I69.PAR.g8913.t1.cds [Oikopleura dioica]|uniref:Oidioi.mRNA.OKI2018_I69.PAR.g8913.t1.cds n=1 Tax=Oikopleura dioica TaxID=34765 RepID=A0ABN7RI41_OIKDI|nr:Oidioi.mRNA.OKI2018_I69.PAR.g8913.t1.cds [Oikopleura dioica]
MVQYSKQVKSTSIALLIFSLLTISIDAVLLATQIINDLLPTFGIGIFLGFFGILAGSYGICAAKATKAEFFFGKYNTSGCWSVFGAIFTFFGLFWLSFAFSCHAVCIAEYGSEDPSGFYKLLTGIVEIDDVQNLHDWTFDNTTKPDEDEGGEIPGTKAFMMGETLTTAAQEASSYEPDVSTSTSTTTSSGQTDSTSSTSTTATTTTTEDGERDNNGEIESLLDTYANKSYVIAYMSLYLSELVLIFILFIVFIILANSTGCCFCGSGVVDIEDEEKGDQDSNASESSDEEDSSSGSDSSDDSSDEGLVQF